MKYTHYFVFSAFLVAALGQRSPYAGRDPVGYPKLETTTSPPTPANPIGNRFGGTTITTTTPQVPLEALGDRNLVNRISKLPVDKQPFWYINWKALEEQRKNQQTYEQRPNPFVSDLSSNVQFGNQNQVRF